MSHAAFCTAVLCSLHHGTSVERLHHGKTKMEPLRNNLNLNFSNLDSNTGVPLIGCPRDPGVSAALIWCRHLFAFQMILYRMAP